MEMKVTGKSPQNTGVEAMIVSAIQSIGNYQYRSAPGLAKQTHIPVEHMEHYLIRLAQSAVVTVGTDQDGVLWVQLGKLD